MEWVGFQTEQDIYLELKFVICLYWLCMVLFETGQF